jgi:hypothetical protein
LSERGLKTRTVSIGEAHWQTLGHCVRKRLFHALVNTPGTHAPLIGADGAKIASLLEGGYADVLVSTDLTRATDLLPLDLCAAIVDGLEQSGRLSETEIGILRILTGPQRLEYSDGEVTSSNGILMGLPTSWAILSLIHLFWIDEVKSTSRTANWRKNHKFSICGDDALIATT